MLQNQFVNFVEGLQKDICEAIASLNQTGFTQNLWQREGGGGGCACHFPSGAIFERGGVNFSKVYGEVLPEMKSSMQVPLDNELFTFFASGISLVMHPHSPHIPTVHMNYRYFEIHSKGKLLNWYFGGGADLTPYYLYDEDVIHFHSTLKEACDSHDSTLYTGLKKDCDQYFYLPHRDEHRGVGGIFSLKYFDKDPQLIFDWANQCGHAFLKSYLPLVERRQTQTFTQKEKLWQKHRRGRYVEFNLMYDVGTAFGLKSKGNTENILMSLPPEVCWSSHFHPDEGSPEAKLMQVIRHPKEWIG